MPPIPSILLIEDSHSQAVAFRLLLEQAGYRVLVAANGMQGLQLAIDHQPRLILLDIDLPVMNGFQVLARLKRSRATSHLPVIMLSHRDHIVDVTGAIDLHADDYLFKEDAQLQLIGAVAQLLSQPLPPTQAEE
jgi:DNA-binding response OmpR family regulator